MDDNYKIAKMLLAKGAGVGLVDGDLWAPLHVACSCAGQDLVLLLLEVCGFQFTQVHMTLGSDERGTANVQR